MIKIEELGNKIEEALTNLQFEDGKTCLVWVEETYTLTPNAGYPYAVFEIDKIGGERFNSCKNIRKYSFKMQVFSAFSSFDGTEQEKRRTARKQIAKIVDRLILKFDTNEFLDGIVDNSDIIDFQFGTFTNADGKDGAGYMVESEIPLDKLIFIK